MRLLREQRGKNLLALIVVDIRRWFALLCCVEPDEGLNIDPQSGGASLQPIPSQDACSH
jgi:hypothetical protein